ncbi:MAG: hypothetical protein M1812_001686 [Candelaria pacifica]|nr:MAG: hypothetical protein M1812_001686 [Candelaria pacifica]
MWWLLRGAQSAAFYYISCAPCHDHVSKRKRKKEAVRARQEKLALETEQPGLFNQPSPFSTNIYWREELALGPGPPPKRGGKDNQVGSQRGLNTGGAGSSLGSSASASHGGSLSPTETHLTMHSSLSEDGWNRKRYQREDESLWGNNVDSPSEYQSGIGGATDGSAGRNRSGTASSGNRYQARNPPVNDYHPPVVSTQPTSKSEIKWMLQPPPSAKIMSGKEPATRSRSNSGGSSRKGIDVNLGKQVGERLMEEKVKRGEGPPGFDLPSPSRVSSKGKQRAVEDVDSFEGQPHDKIPKLPALTRSFEHDSRKPKSMATDIFKDIRSGTGNIKHETTELEELPSKASTNDNHIQAIPTLAKAGQQLRDTPATENSSLPEVSNQSSPPQGLLPTDRNSPSSKQSSRATTSPTNNSLHVLQELVAPNVAFNSRPNSPIPEAMIKLPPSSPTEQEDLKLPEVESRFPGDFRFPDSTPGKNTVVTSRWTVDPLAGTNSTLSSRWSMDI